MTSGNLVPRCRDAFGKRQEPRQMAAQNAQALGTRFDWQQAAGNVANNLFLLFFKSRLGLGNKTY